MNGRKTYLVAAGAILAAIGAFLQGQVELADAIQTIIIALLGATLRHGMKTEAEG